jgi:hypothetical protein
MPPHLMPRAPRCRRTTLRSPAMLFSPPPSATPPFVRRHTSAAIFLPPLFDAFICRLMLSAALRRFISHFHFRSPLLLPLHIIFLFSPDSYADAIITPHFADIIAASSTFAAVTPFRHY